MKSALIGHTGFVGSNINSQYSFKHRFNSKNYKEMKNKEFDLMVCAGVRAEKWLANSDPENDLKSIYSLLNVLEKTKAKKFILISTVDVYMNPSEVDEDTPINPDECEPYGKHRFIVEEHLQRHSDCQASRPLR